MHPAFSVIFFTVVSGAGYGLLFAAALALGLDSTLLRDGEALLALGAGALFTAAGLFASMLHLGQPLRAWRAFSQWRSSWLSREGIASLLTFVPLFALGIALAEQAGKPVVQVLASLLACCAVLTVVCTSKIYTSLKTIRAWHNGFVLPGYLLLGLLGGIAALQALVGLAGAVHGNGDAAHAGNHLLVQWVVAGWIALLAIVTALWKTSYWRFVDGAPLPASAESATGLGRFGSVRSVEAPHTEENYLTHEMGFVLARKHARRLRALSLMLIAVVPLLLVPLLLWMPTASLAWLASGCSIAIALSILAGSFVERWLFFAEAKHVVMLYYGARDKN